MTRRGRKRAESITAWSPRAVAIGHTTPIVRTYNRYVGELISPSHPLTVAMAQKAFPDLRARVDSLKSTLNASLPWCSGTITLPPHALILYHGRNSASSG